LEINTEFDQLLFSEKLKYYLKKNNYSLKELSEKIEVPISTVHGWINGVPPKNLVTIKRIALIFGISVDEMCFGSEVMKESIDSDLVVSIGDQKYKLVFQKIK